MRAPCGRARSAGGSDALSLGVGSQELRGGRDLRCGYVVVGYGVVGLWAGGFGALSGEVGGGSWRRMDTSGRSTFDMRRVVGPPARRRLSAVRSYRPRSGRLRARRRGAGMHTSAHRPRNDFFFAIFFVFSFVVFVVFVIAVIAES